MRGDRALQERLPHSKELWRRWEDSQDHSYRGTYFGTLVNVIKAFRSNRLINYPELVQLGSYLLRDPVFIGMLVLRILVFCSISYSQQWPCCKSKVL